MNKYIKLTNKKVPMTKFNETYSATTNLHNAGLLLNNEVVVVDFDNDNAGELKIIDYLSTKYPTQIVKTTRGVHFYYSKPRNVMIKNGADKITIGGFQVDYKTGETSYTVVKLNNLDREGSTNLKLYDLPELPEICYPLPKTRNLTGLSDHGGRNNALFYHMRCLKEHDVHVNREKVALFINEFCFSDPLAASEIESLLASVAKTESSHNAKDLESFAKFITYELDIKIYQERLYFRKGARHINDNLLLKRAVNEHLNLKRNQWAELENQLFMISDLVDNHDSFKIQIRNGVINCGVVAQSTNEFTPFFLDVSYDPQAYDENVDNFLREITCSKDDLRLTLEELLGHCLMTDGFPHKVFFLLGRGRNGKSTFLEMVNKFSGNLASSVGLTDFDDDTSVASMIGKIVNCSDDIDSDRIDRSKNFKSISSGNSISIRPIYSNTVEFKNTATLIVNANELPTFKDKSVGLNERLLVIPFKLDLTKKQMDATLLDKLSTENAKSYILNLALKGMLSIQSTGKITDNTYTTIALAEYKQDSDSLGAFLDTYPIKPAAWLKDAYASYEAYCDYNNVTLISKNLFSKSLKRFGYKVSPIERNSKSAFSDNRDRRVFSDN